MKNRILIFIGLLIAFLCAANMDKMVRGNHSMIEDSSSIHNIYKDSIALIRSASKGPAKYPVSNGRPYITIDELLK